MGPAPGEPRVEPGMKEGEGDEPQDDGHRRADHARERLDLGPHGDELGALPAGIQEQPALESRQSEGGQHGEVGGRTARQAGEYDPPGLHDPAVYSML